MTRFSSYAKKAARHRKKFKRLRKVLKQRSSDPFFNEFYLGEAIQAIHLCRKSNNSDFLREHRKEIVYQFFSLLTSEKYDLADYLYKELEIDLNLLHDLGGCKPLNYTDIAIEFNCIDIIKWLSERGGVATPNP